MAATREVLAAAGAQIEWEDCLAGAEAFRRGIAAGAPQEMLDSIARNGVALKGPLETPVGHGDKSANVTLRKVFEIYGNIRPAPRAADGQQGASAFSRCAPARRHWRATR